MISNILGVFVLLVVALLVTWLALRAWRARNALVKWAGGLLSSLLALVLLLVSVVMVIGLVKGYMPRKVTVPELSVPITPENIARGEHLARTLCAGCHSTTSDVPLAGGVDMAGDLSVPLGSFITLNLTPAGPLKDWTDGEIFSVVRNGLSPQGQPLAFMSVVRARYMSDEDMLALIAYLRSQPAVPNETPYPPDRINLLGVFLNGAGMLPAPLPPVTGSITAPAKAPSVEYGEYILRIQDCRDCHGEDLKGGKEGQLAPIGWNLELVKNWTLEEFVTTLRTGVDPKGYQLSDKMPWRSVGKMDDVELEAVYNYLKNMP